VHGFDGRWWQRLGHVANAAADQPFCGVGVLLAKNLYAPGDFGKEIAGLKFEIVVVQVSHW
jgi:hypothetical protein